ncbi:MAG: acylneuraminate cytidylyltransferase family protein, partial [Gammaproteobacteria bacterium]|nr:acylneuraminate cytidylyltransferase family protein [Gammaproteobacteria bacterium]
MSNSEKPTVLGVIPARGGSKGVPGKNIRLLSGLPLIVHTIRAAQECNLITDLVLTTDDEEIRQIAVEHGAKAPFLRPDHLATDIANAVPTIQHAVEQMERILGWKFNYIAMLQPTTPLRTAEDLSNALSRLIESDADGIISVVDVDNWHPMKMKRFRGELLMDYEKPPIENPPRQSLPPVYIVNGAIYATKRNVFMELNSFQGERCLGYEMPVERSINIDNEFDFLAAEYYMNRAVETVQ